MLIASELLAPVSFCRLRPSLCFSHSEVWSCFSKAHLSIPCFQRKSLRKKIGGGGFLNATSRYNHELTLLRKRIRCDHSRERVNQFNDIVHLNILKQNGKCLHAVRRSNTNNGQNWLFTFIYNSRSTANRDIPRDRQMIFKNSPDRN